MRPWSLRRSLLAWLLIATVVMGALALIDTSIEARRTADQLADRVLAGSAMVIAERAALGADGGLEIAIPWGALEMLSSPAQDRVFYRVDSEGELITGYGDLPRAEPRPGTAPGFTDASYRGAEVRIATLSRAVSTGIDARPFTVTLAETTRAREELSQAILLRSALRLAGMILGAALIVWIAVTLSLRPLARLGEAIAARNPGDLRPLDTPVPAEVQPPLRAVNSLMAQLETALQGLRNFTGNAAHQLRTPMTVVRTRLALAERATSPAARSAALSEAGDALHRAERVLAQLLAMARIDAAQTRAHSGAPMGEVVDLWPLLRDQTAALVPEAAEAGLDLGLEAEVTPPLRARVEPLLLSEAFGNLLSNALLHAGTGAEITVKLQGDAQEIRIAVEDNGPGIPAGGIDSVLTRFSRGAPDQSAPGSGLGLSIVQDILRLFGGRLELHPRPGGPGLQALIRLPRVSD